MTDTLYGNSIEIDAKTGLPKDYNSLLAGYSNLVKASAARVGIPTQDVEDAAQEVQLKFWLKNGLDLYDPDRRSKFASMYRSWTSMFMLQERDKVIKVSSRNFCTDENKIFDGEVADFSSESDAEIAVLSWVSAAEQALQAANKAHLIPLLRRCVKAAEDNVVVTRADIVEAVGCTLRQATAKLQELREALTTSGMGADSIWT